MGKRSSKRRLNGVKLRRFNLSVDPIVAEKFEQIAGPVSFNVAFEQIVEYVALKKEKRLEKARSGRNSLSSQEQIT